MEFLKNNFVAAKAWHSGADALSDGAARAGRNFVFDRGGADAVAAGGEARRSSGDDEATAKKMIDCQDCPAATSRQHRLFRGK